MSVAFRRAANGECCRTFAGNGNVLSFSFKKHTSPMEDKSGSGLDSLEVKCCWSLGSSYSRGVGIIFHPTLDVKILNFRHDSSGRIIAANIEYKSQWFRLVVYCPNEPVERAHFIKGLDAYLRGASNIILGGDFNFVENSKLDKFGGNPIFGSAGYKELSLLKEDFLLQDTNPSNVTWDKVFCHKGRSAQILPSFRPNICLFILAN